jgi:S-adenosylmethionine:tRNA ribosyltransferase-isomerase
MKTADFDFDIGANVIPSEPLELRGRARDDGRMIVLDRSAATIEHRRFPDICDYLRPGDLLVLNDSYILSNTLSFECAGEPADVTIFGQEPDGTAIVELAPRDQAERGRILASEHDGELTCTLIEPGSDGLWKARFEPAGRLLPALEQHGRRSEESIPLDPMHWRKARTGYRSVYARTPGSLEIPSAGLHFSAELLARIADQGVEIGYITLHVGATELFAVRHIQVERVEDHRMRAEYFEVGAEAAGLISRAMADGRRVVAVGTTVLRTLESLVLASEPASAVQARSGWTDLYIYPGFQLRIADALLTNLHRPRSSHIVLTAAFAGTELVMRSYAEIAAVGGYEFDMFGDSMLIV